MLCHFLLGMFATRLFALFLLVSIVQALWIGRCASNNLHSPVDVKRSSILASSREYIDVEIVNSRNSEPVLPTPSKYPISDKKSSSGVLGTIIKSAVSLISSPARMTAKVINHFAEKVTRGSSNGLLHSLIRRPTLNSEISHIFQNGGVINGLLSGLLIPFSPNTRDIEMIQSAVKKMLERDSDCLECLGTNVLSYPPISSSYSVVSTNGFTRKQFELQYEVTGSRTRGFVETNGEIVDHRAEIYDASLELESGETIRLRTANDNVIDI